MRERTLGVIALAIIVALVVLTTLWQEHGLKRTAFAPEPSTFNASPPGLKAFYTYLQESGRPVERWRAPLKGLPSSPRSLTVVVMTTPSKLAPSDSDGDALADCVAAELLTRFCHLLELHPIEPPGEAQITHCSMGHILQGKEHVDFSVKPPLDPERVSLRNAASDLVQGLWRPLQLLIPVHGASGIGMLQADAGPDHRGMQHLEIVWPKRAHMYLTEPSGHHPPPSPTLALPGTRRTPAAGQKQCMPAGV